MADFTAKLLSAPAFRSTRRQALTLGEGSPFDALDQEIADVGAAIEDVRRRVAPYASQMTYDREKASEGMRALKAWANDNGQAVSALPPDTVLSDKDRATLGVSESRAFLSYLWIESADAFAMQSSGQMKAAVAAGVITIEDAFADLKARRSALQLLTAMDEQGSVAMAFGGTPVNGLGALPAVLLAVKGYELLILVALAIVGFLTYSYFSAAAYSERAMQARQKVCDQAAEMKDAEGVKRCRESILAAAADKPWDPVNVAIAVVGGVGLIYLLANNVLPKYLDRRSAAEPA